LIIHYNAFFQICLYLNNNIYFQKEKQPLVEVVYVKNHSKSQLHINWLSSNHIGIINKKKDD